MSETVSQIKRKYNKQELAQELFKLRNKVKKEEAQDPNIRDAEERAGIEALANVTNLSPEDMASAMTKLGVGVNNTLQTVTSKIIDGRNTLADLERACEAKEAELTNLFGQEVVARSLGDAIADHDTKRKEFAAKHEELKEELDRAEAAAERQKQEWQRQFTEDCQRARNDFNYQFQKEQREQRDAFAQQLKTERQQFDDEQRDRERAWEEREADINKRALEVAEKEQEIAVAEEKIKAKAESDKKAAIEAISRNHKHEMAIIQKDAETQARIADATIQGLEAQVSKQQTEIDALKAALAQSQTEVGSIANKALEASAGRLALDSVLTQQDGQSGRARGKN